jgi:hypothetical protein
VIANQQKFAEAEVETEQAVKLNPKDATALAADGTVEAHLGKSAEGIALLRNAVAWRPNPQPPIVTSAWFWKRATTFQQL